MGFCWACGKKAGNMDKFCTECGTPIIESKITVMEETGEIIKEEYRVNTVTPVELSRGSPIGDQKRSGEVLEDTIEHILKFAGFETKRSAPFVFSDSTGDHFKIDVLANDHDIEIFVECKDYADLKMSEKIMQTLTDQLVDYRKNQSKRVVGILAIDTRDDGRNVGIKERLQKHGSFLWDGYFIEHLENKMIEFGNKEDFRRYVLDHIQLFDEPKKQNNEDYNIMIKYSFYTINPEKYVGKFDVMNIIDEIKTNPHDLPIKIIDQKFESQKSRRGKIYYKIILNFGMILSPKEVKKYAEKNKSWREKLFRYSDLEIVFKNYKETVFSKIANTYGISYKPRSQILDESITYEGYRIT